MTPERRLEIEQAANLYGSGDGSTGTILAEMIRELIAEIDLRLSPIDVSDVANLPEYTFQIECAGEIKDWSVGYLTLAELLAECDNVNDDRLRFLNIYSNNVFVEHFYFTRDDSPQFQSCIDTEAMPLSKYMADRCNLEYLRISREVNNDRS